MRLVTFEIPTAIGSIQRIGMISNDRIIDLNMGYQLYLTETRNSQRVQEMANTILPTNMLDFLRGGNESKEAARITAEYVNATSGKDYTTGPCGRRVIYNSTEIHLKSPVLRPNSLRDYLSFEDHASFGGQRQLPQAWYEMPICYKGNVDTIIGPEDTIPWPSFCDLLDYELEYGIFISKIGSNIPREKANEYIAGYTIFNDISARDIQMQEMTCGLGPVKGKDTCSILGPCLVTPDEVNTQDMRMIARINGEVWSDNNSGTSYWTWPEIIEFASMDEILYPGDFLGSGTVGKGCGLELGKWIQPGDVIELEVEGIGTLRNKVGIKPTVKRIFSR
ncbi:MAG: fumarylacetoacetate hydrolase family protein [Chloroflexota bacterium]|nr:fumarylacetoacetate hydrolase family protein [Chloroflexota bacterium]